MILILTKPYNSKALYVQSGITACNQHCSLIAGAKFRPGRAILGWVMCCSETTLELFYLFFLLFLSVKNHFSLR